MDRLGMCRAESVLDGFDVREQEQCVGTVLAGQRGERGNRFEDVLFLNPGFRRLPPLQEGVPAEGGHDSHGFCWFSGDISFRAGVGSLARPPCAVPSIWTLLLTGMTPMTPVT